MRTPINGTADSISVQGRYLVHQDGSRFLMKGIAFPVVDNPLIEYNAQGWIAVLEQLAASTDINTVRLYHVDCGRVDYSEFLNRAADLGIYVIVPLTASAGAGVLDRDKPAPSCYPRKMYSYGKKCLDQFTAYPSVIAGTLGNEVMNSLETWKAAPCIRAYARDLKAYMADHTQRSLPLLYASQHDSMTVELPPSKAMLVTLDYLACEVDIFGINVETWCSSQQTFEFNEDGSEGDYFTLWKTLQNASIPVIFSEMGCGQDLFDRDNGLHKGVRDWKQVPVVLNNMSDVFSGFCAYAYSGNPLFSMMHGVWNGKDILEPTIELENFGKQLREAEPLELGPVPRNISSLHQSCSAKNPLIPKAKAKQLDLFPMELMPRYSEPMYLPVNSLWVSASLVLFAAFSCAYFSRRCCAKSKELREDPFQTTYQSISTQES